MSKKKISDAEAKRIIAKASKAMDAALVAAGEIQREAMRKPAQDPLYGLTPEDWKALGLPGDPKKKKRQFETARLEARLKQAAKRLQMDPLVARFQKLGREINRN